MQQQQLVDSWNSSESVPQYVLEQFLITHKEFQEEKVRWILSETSKINRLKQKIHNHTLLLKHKNNIELENDFQTECKVDSNNQLEEKSEEIIRLNVGGKLFTTCLKTLLSEADTFFSGFFSDYFHPQIQKVKIIDDGEEIEAYFIDRNPKNFQLILDHLRGHKIGPKIQSITSKGGDELFDLVEEVAFYQVRSIYPLFNEEGKELLKEHFSIELVEEEKMINLKEAQTVPSNKRLNLTMKALRNIPEEHRRTVLGETLHPFVLKLEREHANKITGMLLEMELSNILKWIEDEEELKKIVAEAISVLKGSSLY